MKLRAIVVLAGLLLMGCATAPSDPSRMSFGEIDALMRQIGTCWTLPAGVDDLDQVVRLRVSVRPDRTVEEVTIEDQARLASDPEFRAIAESAERAVERCSPLELPAGKYAIWREIDMNFNPAWPVGAPEPPAPGAGA
jgi:hypothetical protein